MKQQLGWRIRVCRVHFTDMASHDFWETEVLMFDSSSDRLVAPLMLPSAAAYSYFNSSAADTSLPLAAAFSMQTMTFVTYKHVAQQRTERQTHSGHLWIQ